MLLFEAPPLVVCHQNSGREKVQLAGEHNLEVAWRVRRLRALANGFLVCCWILLKVLPDHIGPLVSLNVTACLGKPALLSGIKTKHETPIVKPTQDVWKN